jgi:hypothetical protein
MHHEYRVSMPHYGTTLILSVEHELSQEQQAAWAERIYRQNPDDYRGHGPHAVEVFIPPGGENQCFQ